MKRREYYVLQELLASVAEYALESGEPWRVGPGAEIMDAYEAVQAVFEAELLRTKQYIDSHPY